jgi:CheY-like chemotaxis protein
MSMRSPSSNGAVDDAECDTRGSNDGPKMTLKPVRVLIVDDDVEAADLLARLLERRGHDVSVAHDVAEALRVARDFVPDVALLDLMIRCESGYFLARDLREVAELAQCRFVAMTGFAQEQHRRSSQAAGFHRHLVKPIDTEQLFDAIESTEERRAVSD